MPDNARKTSPRPHLIPLMWLGVGLLAGCANAGPPQVPVSGVTGSNGGADETQYYDNHGRPHFAN